MSATEPPKRDLSRYWLEYFAANTTSLLEIPWGRGAEITVAERRAIASSIPEFQLGESSEQRILPSNLRSRRCSIDKKRSTYCSR